MVNLVHARYDTASQTEQILDPNMDSLGGSGGGAGNYLGAYSLINLPAAAANGGYWAFCTNFGVDGALLYSNGVRWKPSNGSAQLKTLETLPTITGAVALVFTGATLAIPAGMWQQGDILEVMASVYKDAGANTFTMNTRFGVLGDATDGALDAAGFSLATTSRSTGTTPMRFRRISATSVQKLGSAGVATGSNGASSTTPFPAAVAVTNLDTTAQILSLSAVQTIGSTETATLAEWSVRYISSTN